MESNGFDCKICKHSCCFEITSFTSELDGAFYHVLRCDECGVLFLNPIPQLSTEKLEKIYGENYAETVYPLEHVSIVENALNKQMEIVEKYVKKGDMLNVGAMGAEINIFKKRGWNLHIVDVSKYAVERTRSRGDYNITLSKIEDFSCPPESFEFIKLGHVIEHLTDPELVIKKLWTLLRPGGIILIDTDNADGLETRIEAVLMWVMQINFIRRIAEALVGRKYHLRYGRLTPPVHLYTFTPKSLRLIAERNGFEVIQTFNPSWGDSTWFPLPRRNLFETMFKWIDKIGEVFNRGNVIVVLARKTVNRK
jgi:2-polyprenyl-3-methyl-5-hydroxy-6-metoxy-1,4-benzoquinol methylase